MDADPLATTALDSLAHDLRNRMNVAAGGVSLLSDDHPDDQLLADTLVATRSIGTDLERLIAAARLDLRRFVFHDVSLGALVDAGLRRAGRELGAEPPVTAAAGLPESCTITAPGALAERLIADLVHVCGHPAAASLELEPDGRHAELVISSEPGTSPAGGERSIALATQVATGIAAACGWPLHLGTDGSTATLRLGPVR